MHLYFSLVWVSPANVLASSLSYFSLYIIYLASLSDLKKIFLMHDFEDMQF